MGRYRPDLTEAELNRELAAFDPDGGLRFGQVIVNAYLKPGRTDPEVYYCEDSRAAFDLIVSRLREADPSG